MMYKNQQDEILQTLIMAISPKMKERTVKCDRCNPTKEPPMVKSVFSLEHKDGK